MPLSNDIDSQLSDPDTRVLGAALKSCWRLVSTFPTIEPLKNSSPILCQKELVPTNRGQTNMLESGKFLQAG